MTAWVGIDVSKETLDLAWFGEEGKKHHQVPNDGEGFRKLVRAAPEGAKFVMEATGTYYLNLALFLHEEGRHVSVVNPIRIKGHMKSELTRTKSDKADAYAIAKFGEEKRPGAWFPVSAQVAHLKQLVALDELLTKESTSLSNLMESQVCTAFMNPETIQRIKRVRRYMDLEREGIKAELEALLMGSLSHTVDLIASIPGIGRATAIKFVATVGDFRRFPDSRKLVSFLGMSPMSRQSGTSVRSKGHISRLGGTRLRGALYVCAWTAIEKNASCRAMWERMKEKKIHGKKAIVAVMGKMIRQAYSVVIHDRFYDPNFA